MNPDFIPPEVVELPDYKPEELSDLEKKTISLQNDSLGIKEETIVPVLKRSTNQKFVNSTIYSVIKDNEYYLSAHGGVTTSIEEAKQFDNPDSAQIYLNRKKDTSEFSRLLIPEVQDIRINLYHLKIYEEIN